MLSPPGTPGCCSRAEARHAVNAAARALRAQTGGGDVVVVPLDLADLTSVAALAARVQADHERLDVLVANAGVMAVDRGVTVDGHEVHIGVNHFGHMALVLRVLPVLAATPGARVVVVTSSLHRFGRVVPDDLSYDRRRYGRLRAYSQSKLANLLFVAELDRRLRAQQVSVSPWSAPIPGRPTPVIGTEGEGWANWIQRHANSGPLTQTAAAGAWPLLRAATDPGIESRCVHRPPVGHEGSSSTGPSRAPCPLGCGRRRGLWDASELAIGLRLSDALAAPAPDGARDAQPAVAASTRISMLRSAMRVAMSSLRNRVL